MEDERNAIMVAGQLVKNAQLSPKELPEAPREYSYEEVLKRVLFFGETIQSSWLPFSKVNLTFEDGQQKLYFGNGSEKIISKGVESFFQGPSGSVNLFCDVCQIFTDHTQGAAQCPYSGQAIVTNKRIIFMHVFYSASQTHLASWTDVYKFKIYAGSSAAMQYKHMTLSDVYNVEYEMRVSVDATAYVGAARPFPPEQDKYCHCCGNPCCNYNYGCCLCCCCCLYKPKTLKTNKAEMISTVAKDESILFRKISIYHKAMQVPNSLDEKKCRIDIEIPPDVAESLIYAPTESVYSSGANFGFLYAVQSLAPMYRQDTLNRTEDLVDVQKATIPPMQLENIKTIDL